MRQLLEQCGFRAKTITREPEMSFPLKGRLKRVLRFDAAVWLALPIAAALLAVFQVRNKMLVVATRGPEDQEQVPGPKTF
jgi:hypothetical protein